MLAHVREVAMTEQPRPRLIGVIGTGEGSPTTDALAHEVGRRLAEAGCSIVTGGLAGVMAAAARGHRDGRTADDRCVAVGVVPGPDATAANVHVDVVIATGAGEARNCVIVNSASTLIAIGGGFGTLSEIALALRQDKCVIALESWSGIDEGVVPAVSAEEAVDLALAHERQLP
jgi:uncharacterized protein (TIGR00725 family)